MLKVSAVPPRRSAMLTVFRGATSINDGTTAIMAVSLRNHGDNGGATAVYAVQAPQQTCQVSRNLRESPEIGCDLQVSRNCKENSRN